jgi:hypothetical protein
VRIVSQCLIIIGNFLHDFSSKKKKKIVGIVIKIVIKTPTASWLIFLQKNKPYVKSNKTIRAKILPKKITAFKHFSVPFFLLFFI